MLWCDGTNTINYVTELAQQMRIVYCWYNAFLEQGRAVYLDDEMYDLISVRSANWTLWISDSHSFSAGTLHHFHLHA